MLEEYDALAAETTSEEDEDGTGLEAGAWFGRVDGFADLLIEICQSNCTELPKQSGCGYYGSRLLNG